MAAVYNQKCVQHLIAFRRRGLYGWCTRRDNARDPEVWLQVKYICDGLVDVRAEYYMCDLCTRAP